jgi:hypothetical protein
MCNRNGSDVIVVVVVLRTTDTGETTMQIRVERMIEKGLFVRREKYN